MSAIDPDARGVDHSKVTTAPATLPPTYDCVSTVTGTEAFRTAQGGDVSCRSAVGGRGSATVNVLLARKSPAAAGTATAGGGPGSSGGTTPSGTLVGGLSGSTAAVADASAAYADSEYTAGGASAGTRSTACPLPSTGSMRRGTLVGASPSPLKLGEICSTACVSCCSPVGGRPPPLNLRCTYAAQVVVVVVVLRVCVLKMRTQRSASVSACVCVCWGQAGCISA